MIIDISKLPAPAFIEPLSYELILAENKVRFLSYCTPELREVYEKIIDLESEPVVKLLEESAYKEFLLRNRINEAALATTLAYATGDDLDVVAALFGVKRFLIDVGDSNANPPIEPIYESDEHLRERAQLALEAISTGGHGAGYRVRALNAHRNVRDASVVSPSPAHVDIYLLSHDEDGVAGDEVIKAVEVALNPETAIPIADRVEVKRAEIVPYEVMAKVYLFNVPESEPVLESVRDRGEAYKTSSFKLGRDIRLSAIHAALHVDGVQRVELTNNLKDIVIDDHQAALCTRLVIEFGGFDE